MAPRTGRLRRALRAAGQGENLPYTLLAGLALISLAARLLLIGR